MSKKRKILFVGLLEEKPSNGETMKNHLFVQRFNELYDKVLVFNAKNVKHKPWKITKLVWLCLLHRKINIFVSASPGVGRPLVKLMKLMACKNIYYWMVGGTFHNKVKTGEWNKSFYQKMKCVIVQSSRMLESLKEQGFTNVYYVSNSKRIDFLPDISKRNNANVRFVFLSRINPTKGCGEIIESVKQLNDLGYQNRFSVDFYGKIDQVYPEFPSLITEIPNVQYKGFLDLTQKEGYEQLSQYDMMLFPTYWDGEGFPGVIIDSYIAGVPVLASDWNLNCDYVNDKTGIIIPHHNQQLLFEEMKKVIENQYDLDMMSRNSQSLAMQYDNRLVITKEKLKEIGAF